MKIALIGTRGVPARYGGFETCVEEMGKALAAKGHDVSVYCRSGYYKEKRTTYLGMRLFYLREPRIKPLETLLHTLFSLLHALLKRNDILFVFNSANSPWILIPKILKKKVVLHMDGLEWRREKWSPWGRRYYKFAEWLGTKLAVELVSDSEEIQKYFRQEYGKETHYISFGARLQRSRDASLLQSFRLKPNQFFLQVTRFEPENNPLLSVKAFENLETDKQLVLVGGSRYRTSYVEALHATRDRRIQFLGFIYDKDILRELFCNCYAYIHGNEVGGTNPALLEAMASGCFVVCRDVPFNREVVQDAGLYFDKDEKDLEEKLAWTLDNESVLTVYREKAKTIIQKRYQWDAVLAKYDRLFRTLLEAKK